MSKRAVVRNKKTLDLQISARTGRRFAAFLSGELPRAFAFSRSELRELSVALVGDVTMSRLHRQFMNIDGPTDVLTFELEHGARGRVIAGEVVICVPEATRAARRHGTKVEHELLLYAIHGLLHLSGYDDLSETAYRAMHREEDRILTAMNVGPVFEPAPKVLPAIHRPKKDGRSR